MKKLLCVILLGAASVSCFASSPKLFFTSSDVSELRQRIHEPELEPIWQAILQKANDYCTVSSPEYVDPTSSWFVDGDYGWYGRDVQGWVETIGFVYQITGNPFYGNHGAAILASAADYEAPEGSLLDMNLDMMRTLAVGYDWLYSAMTVEQKAKIETVARGYIEWSVEFGNWGPYHNFMGVGYGGMGLLAIVMEDVYPDYAPVWIAIAENSILEWFNMGFDQKGAYFEGHDYMQYGFSNAIALADALKRNKSVDIFTNANLSQIAHYLAQIRLPGMAVYEGRNDSRYSYGFDVSILRLSEGIDSSLLRWLWDEAQQYWEQDYHIGGYSPLRIIWDNDVIPLAVTDSEEPLNEHFAQRGLAAFRSGWQVEDTLFTIEAGPYYDVTHNQADKGHFGFYGLGYIWAADTIYGNNRDVNGRCQTVAHNCILVDGVGQALSGASYGIDGEISAYYNYPNYGYALADATSAYNTNNYDQPGAVVEHALRHTVYVRQHSGKPAYAVVFDDIEKDQNSHDYTWQLLSWDNMDIDISGDNPIVMPLEYVETPEGTSGTGLAVWTVDITEAGTYELWGRVRANGEFVSGSDSFKVQIDEQDEVNWYFSQNSDRLWTWEKVSDTSEKLHVSFELEAGTHQIKFKTRETGSQLAAAFLTDNLSQSAPITPFNPGFFFKASQALVTAPMAFFPADSAMQVIMDGESTISYGFDFYEPDDGRVPESFPRLRASCESVNPRFITFMMPHYNSQTLPDVTFSDVAQGRKITINWPDRTDEMVWTANGVDVNLGIGNCAYTISGDINEDCVVNVKDLADFAQSWMLCSMPYEQGCVGGM